MSSVPSTTDERRVGHVVLNVSSLERSVPFYRDLLGLREVARLDEQARALLGNDMVFFSFGENHHDLGLREVPGAAAYDPNAVGIAHVAVRMGRDKAQFKAIYERVLASGMPISHTRDHRVSWSVYVRDPDGILIELYVDGDPSIWRDNPQAVATVKPLVLD